jgi:hypothetical protein
MAFRDFQHREREVSTVEEAGSLVRRMVHREANGWGDQGPAQRRLEVKYGIPFWSLEHLRTGRAKTVDGGLLARIRAAYLDLCERQVAKLQHEIAVEKAINEDDSLGDLEREAEELASRIAAARARRR